MPEEILNIEYHTRRLMLITLNQERTVKDAAIALGITERTLFNYMSQFNIKRVFRYEIVKPKRHQKNDKARTPVVAPKKRPKGIQ